jgi:glutamate-ammonia-ligase adenylyltransferase
MNAHRAVPAAGREGPLERAARLSHYARRLIEAEPRLAAECAAERAFGPEEMRAALAARPARDERALKRALRELRKRVMLRLIARDLAGLAPLGEVFETTTALAEIAIAHALEAIEGWLAARHGFPLGEASGRRQSLHVVGMGKLGGSELNVSSDIDLVFVYPEEGETDGARRLSNHEYFTLLARGVIGALSEITEDGHVFRVDARLRPYGEGGPLVTSFEMLENYFVTQGREWERYAWIKARVLTGDRRAELGEIVRPFVYRRHLDYNAIASLRDLHRQIRREVARRDIADNIKLGPGGIREIEFVAQVFQLIRGGRDPALRRHETRAVLALLAERRLLPAEAARELEEAYAFLRRLEHRLQYLDDQQTHVPPASAEDRARVAEAMGFADYAALLAELERHRARVTHHFEQIFAGAPAAEHRLAHLWQEGGDPERAEAELAALGFREPRPLAGRLRELRAGARYRALPAASQARLDALVPPAIEVAARQPHPDETLHRLLDLLEAVSGRAAYLALLAEYPQALERLAAMAAASPWVAQYLAQHPILLDELLDPRTLLAAPDWEAARRELRAQLEDAAGDAERQMDALRHFKHAHTIRLAAQDLAGELTVERLSDHLSDLAGVVLEEVLRLAWATLRQAHRERPRFAVIGYGKLGGKELGYATDLDLVFLYDDPAPEAAEVYARFAQRINTWLTSFTSAGVLYETDLRLRPDGAGGMLVSPFESFRDYQLEKAWTWEHQALSRARFVAGDADIGHRFEALRVEVLRRPRDPVALASEIVAMRRRIHDAHPNRTALFDLKHDPGGIVDVEFIVQYLVLAHARAHEPLAGNVGNIALLDRAASFGLVPAGLAARARDAYREFRRRQHRLRLAGSRYARVPREEVAEHAAAVAELWRFVFGEPGAGANASADARPAARA